MNGDTVQTLLQTERDQIRGSSLLLTGRIIALAMNFGVQVSIVRYLQTSEYGAWAAALAAVLLCEAFSTLNLQTSLARFVPVYHETRQLAKLFGAVVFSVAVVGIFSMVCIGGLFAAPGRVLGLLNNPQAVSLLLILIFLVPVESLDLLVEALFASVGGARAIFWRKYILAPGLKLCAVAVLVATRSGARCLAFGYVSAALVGLAIYTVSLAKRMRVQGWVPAAGGALKIPARELLVFTIPVMTTSLVSVLTQSVATLLLAHYRDPVQVAYYRAVFPAATLSQIVFQSFALLYTPAAARLFGRREPRQMQSLYWRNALWMGVLSLPVFVATFAFAEPLTVLIFGSGYRGAAPALALLSLGYYVSVAAGFDAYTLQVLGKVRLLTMVNLIVVAAYLPVNLLLIPRYGATGAALGTLLTMLLHTALKQAALRRSGLALPLRELCRFYGLVCAAIVVAAVAHFISHAHLAAAIALSAVTVLAFFSFGLKYLKLTEIFPEALASGTLKPAIRAGERCAYVLLKALDAIVTAPLRPAEPASSNWRCLLNPRSAHYDRVAAAVRLADRASPGFLARAVRWVVRLEHLPFPHQGTEVLGYGAGATVLRLRNCGGGDAVLKIYRLSLGRGASEVLKIAVRFKKQHERVSRWYNNRRIRLVPPMQFLVVQGPVLGRPAAAGVQPYIGGEKRDLLQQYSDAELVELMRRYPTFRAEFEWFARRTLGTIARETCCFDMLGTGNLMVILDDEAPPRLVVLDSDFFDLHVLGQESPERLERLADAIARIRSLLAAVEADRESAGGWAADSADESRASLAGASECAQSDSTTVVRAGVM